MGERGGRRGRQAGFALVSALWLGALIALIAAGASRETRGLADSALAAGARAEADALAEAALWLGAMTVAAELRGLAPPRIEGQAPWATSDLRALEPGRALPLDGSPRGLRLEGARVTLRALAERARFDLIVGEPAVFARLAAGLGAADPAGAAAALIRRRDGAPGGVRRIPWRLDERPFEGPADLLSLAGLVPEEARRLIPYVTVWSGRSEPDARLAPPALAAALAADADGRRRIEAARAAADPTRLDDPRDAEAVSVTAIVETEAGARSVRSAVFAIARRGQPVRLLAWGEDAPRALPD